MKKLLAVLVVLALSSASFAGFLLEPFEVLNEGPSTITLTNDTAITAGVGEGYVAILVTPEIGALDVETQGSVVSPDISAYNGAVSLFGVDKPGMEGVWVGVFTFGAGYEAGTALVNMQFNPAGALGNIELWQLDEIGVSSVALLDVVKVVPEPMTMSLLALGGLGLLRRR